MGHPSNQDTCLNYVYIEICTKSSLKLGHLLNQDTSCCHSGVRSREVPLLHVVRLKLDSTAMLHVMQNTDPVCLCET